jgi:hypothetical protein
MLATATSGFMPAEVAFGSPPPLRPRRPRRTPGDEGIARSLIRATRRELGRDRARGLATREIHR